MKLGPATRVLLAAWAVSAGEGDVQHSRATNRLEKATFANGCFWCTEAVFERIPGVEKVSSGYTGGTVENPTYKQVCRGDTGHAEAVEIVFDPSVVSYEKLLDVFWQSHDPTTPNRQGADVGSQYRSVIFYHDEAQKKAAEASRTALRKSGKYRDPIVTSIEPAGVFYVAESYHQDFYRNNDSEGYSRAVIAPKLRKLGLEP